MPTPPVDERVSRRFKAAIERCLRDGYSPFRVSGGRGSAVERAARDLRIRPARLQCWVRRQEALRRAGAPHHEPDWSLHHPPGTGEPAAPRRRERVRRWLLTAAQNDTAVHAGFWQNLIAYAEAVGAEIVVGPFTYQLGVFTDHTTRAGVFAEAVRPHLRFDRLDCGPVLFCAEMNTLPTAVRPLSGLHTYTRGAWGVFPHAKVALESVPAMPGARPTLVMTTGCCTVENYIPKKAGIKASFHHVIGATLVEVDAQGRAFCRQINATEDGAFQDLDVAVARGRVVAGRRVAAVTWGDIHASQIDPEVAAGSWGFDAAAWAHTGDESMVDTLQPYDQFFHDLFNGESVSHWLEKAPHERYGKHLAGRLDVVAEVTRAAAFLRAAGRPWCRSHVVESNHDLWIGRWLQRATPWDDLPNAEAWCRWNLAALEAKRRGDEAFSVFRHVLREADARLLEGVNFIPEGGSWRICQDRGGIECGLHGHLGPNGSRGSSAALVRAAMKINKGHDHTASIVDGVYSAGTCSLLQCGYNKSPSTWTHSDIVTYPNGKRTIVTKHGPAWRA